MLLWPSFLTTLFALDTLRPVESNAPLKPRVFIINMFLREAAEWHAIPEFDILARNITIPGLFPLFPDVHCTADGQVCQLITGQAEINAAASVLSLLHAHAHFDLTSTYFILSGVAGMNPRHGTVGGVAFARFAIQSGLQHELDARETPPGFASGYLALGTTRPGEYPGWVDGTEVFEVNDALRQAAARMAASAPLVDTQDCVDLRAPYAAEPAFAAGAAPPAVVFCDTLTSDTFWSGTLLAAAFENTTRVLTNGLGSYCSTQQEDNAILGAMLRGALAGWVDFGRILIMRSGSDFDRPPPGGSSADNLFAPLVAMRPATVNLRLAGLKVVQGILDGWDATFEQGIKPTNYIGDILGSLGEKPDFLM